MNTVAHTFGAPRTILLVLDDTPGVFEEALRIATQHKAHLTGLFVMDATWHGYVAHDWLSGSGSRADFLDYIKEEEIASAKAAQQRFEEQTSGVVDAEFVMSAGSVVEQTIAQMHKGYDLVVVPNPLRRGLEVMRDGVAELARKAPCRVLLVPARQ